MEKKYRNGAMGAILDEYERALSELKLCISDIADEDLPKVLDANTADENCKSIQTILAHVVSAMKNYAIYTAAVYGGEIAKSTKIKRDTIRAYMNDLDEAFAFNIATLKDVEDKDLDNQEMMIHVHWGQAYDIEQMMEHAIVHILRHRRQLERFKILLKK